MDEPSDLPSVLRIDCDECVAAGTSACADCLVTFLHRPGESAVVLDLEEQRAVRRLQEVGLVPRCRHRAERARP